MEGDLSVLKKAYAGQKKNGPLVKSASCSSKGPWFNLQHPHGDFTITPVPRDMMPFSGLLKSQACMWYTNHKPYIHKTIKIARYDGTRL